MKGLIIFDLDGTIVEEPEFYRSVYSGTLNELVSDLRGEEGLKVLDFCRKNYNGKGELALLALNIPFKEWAKRLIEAPVDSIRRRLDIVDHIRSVPFKKVLYTGSPIEMVSRTLKRIGLEENDFEKIIGWEKPESFPLKWLCSPFVFRAILTDLKCEPQNTWSVGDTWDTDLEPASFLGIKTAIIKKVGGKPDRNFVDLISFLDYLKSVKEIENYVH